MKAVACAIMFYCGTIGEPENEGQQKSYFVWMTIWFLATLCFLVLE